ncbi:MAG: acyl-CoA desaturase, partial [Pseudomonadales bacterium]|nr:acyl-CoA desaturase [Pseudomonadales bacterium]
SILLFLNLIGSVFIYPSTALFLLSVVFYLLYWVGITIGFHRLNSHRSFETFAPIKAALLYLGCQGHQGSPIFWGVVHNKNHHAHTDTEKDLLSPSHGILHTLFVWHYKSDARQFVADNALGSRQFLDKQNRFFNQYYVPLFYLNLLGLYFIGGPTFVSASLNGTFLVYSIISGINVIGHMEHWGSYRNYDTQDNSMNNALIGFVTLGEGYHNNHHAAPRMPNFDRQWWEVDLGYFLIQLIRSDR